MDVPSAVYLRETILESELPVYVLVQSPKTYQIIPLMLIEFEIFIFRC